MRLENWNRWDSPNSIWKLFWCPSPTSSLRGLSSSRRSWPEQSQTVPSRPLAQCPVSIFIVPSLALVVAEPDCLIFQTRCWIFKQHAAFLGMLRQHRSKEGHVLRLPPMPLSFPLANPNARTHLHRAWSKEAMTRRGGGGPRLLGCIPTIGGSAVFHKCHSNRLILHNT